MLHTSDWHLGRGFHGGSLRAEQSELLTTLCATVKEKQVDVVLVSGDIYDRALPPEWAIKELEDCLLELARDGTEVIITSGNHDSAQRLGFGRGLMAASGVHIRSALADAWAPVELTGDDGAALLVYGVPYLEPQLYAGELGVRPNHTALMTEVLAKVREDAEQRRRSSGQNPTVVVMAHVFVSKGVASESERHIGAPAVAEEALEHHEDSIGGLAVVPLDVFDGFDYVGPGPPPRAAAAQRPGPLQRIPSALLLLRGEPHQGRLVGGCRRTRFAEGGGDSGGLAHRTCGEAAGRHHRPDAGPRHRG